MCLQKRNITQQHFLIIATMLSHTQPRYNPVPRTKIQWSPILPPQPPFIQKVANPLPIIIKKPTLMSIARLAYQRKRI